MLCGIHGLLLFVCVLVAAVCFAFLVWIAAILPYSAALVIQTCTVLLLLILLGCPLCG